MFSSPENDRKIRTMNIILTAVAIVLVISFGFFMMFDNSHNSKLLSEEIAQTKEEEDKQRQEIFEERKQQEEREKKRETDSFFEKLGDGFDVRILVIGDEIGVGDGVDDKSKAWTELLADKIEKNYNVEAYIKNVSMSGNSSYAGYVRTMVISDRVQYDLAIICYGANDQTEGFSEQYESILRALRKNYDKCSVISVLESSNKKYNDKTKAIQQLADHYDCFCADLIKPFTDGSNGSYDSLTDKSKVCPNNAGHQVYADTIYDVIDEQVDNAAKYSAEEVEPLNKSVGNYDNLLALNARDFTQEGDNYIYKVNQEVKGIAGIDYKYVTGDNGCRIFIDGKEYKAPEASPDNEDFELRILKIQKNAITIKDSIEVRYETKEQSEGFRGVVISSANEDFE